MLLDLRKVLQVAACALGLVFALVPCASLSAEEVTIDCQVLFRTTEGIYIDAGAEAGLVKGTTVRLLRGGNPAGDVEIAEVASGSTLLKPVSGNAEALPAAGERVSIVLQASQQQKPKPAEPSETLKDRTQKEEPFTPLLAPPQTRKEAFTDIQNIFHGRLTFQQIFQVASDEHDFTVTRFGSSGGIDRIDGTPWSFEWSGDITYRDGDVYEDTSFYEEVRVQGYRAVFSRRLDDRSHIRIGRFIPLELPAVGYLDGIQFEKVVSERFRFGSMLGFKPERDDLGVSFKEPTWAAYGTYEIGSPQEKFYTVTGGFLASLFDWTPDRFAILVDQRANLNKLTLYCSSEVDIPVGASVERDGVRLTRLDLYSSYEAAKWLTLRAGVNHYELPDNEGERDVIEAGGLAVEEFFRGDYWRYWAGAVQRFGRLEFAEEVSYYDSEIGEDVRYMVSVARHGFPRLGLPDASLTVALYNLTGIWTEGYGGRIDATLPFLRRRLLIQPAVYFRFLETETSGANFFDQVSKDFTVSDLSVRAYWTISKAWSASLGASYALTTEADRLLVDFGLTFRW